jgi:hypothetical protein
MSDQGWGNQGGTPNPYAAGQPGAWQPPAPPTGPPGPPGQWYGPPPGYPGWAPPRPTNGMAVASMVLGILWIYWIGSILALVFGYVARNQIRERGEGGAGMAMAGIVLGWVGIGILGLLIVVGLVASVAP